MQLGPFGLAGHGALQYLALSLTLSAPQVALQVDHWLGSWLIPAGAIEIGNDIQTSAVQGYFAQGFEPTGAKTVQLQQ